MSKSLNCLHILTKTKFLHIIIGFWPAKFCRYFRRKIASKYSLGNKLCCNRVRCNRDRYKWA